MRKFIIVPDEQFIVSCVTLLAFRKSVAQKQFAIFQN